MRGLSGAELLALRSFELHAGARLAGDLRFRSGVYGKNPVERFRDAAEKYGYIVAGSNNSRNSSWQASSAAIRAMPSDVGARLSIDEKRVYTAGLSGGARVAMEVALGTGRIAGVIASSAGYPDAVPRKTVPFAVFGTAGTRGLQLPGDATAGQRADIATSSSDIRRRPYLAFERAGNRGAG